MIKELNVRPDTVKLLEDNVGKMLQFTGISEVFLNSTILVEGLI